MPEEKISPAVVIAGGLLLGLGATAAVAAIAWAALPEVYTCPVCGAEFTTEEELLAHMEAEHPEVPPPSALLYEYKSALNEAYIAVEAGYPDDFVMIPRWGLQYADVAIPQLKQLMIEEAIRIGMITSASDVYFEREHMYYSDGTRIV